MRLHALIILLCLLPALARADYTVKDSTGSTITIESSTNGSVHTTHTVPSDGSGTRQGTSSAPFRVDPTGSTTQPVSAASLPLPDGAATQATLASTLTELQTLVSSIAAINAKLAALGQTTMSGSMPVTMASNQTAISTAVSSIAAGDNNVGNVDVATISAGDNNIGNVDVATLPALASGTNNIGDVDVLTLPALAAGNNNVGDVDVASIAAGDNNIGNVDLASAIPAGTNNIGDVDVLSISAGDNNIGNVDIASALPAGTNAIGKLSANSGVDIGDVDVTSISAGNNNIGDVDVASVTPPSTVYAGQTAVTTSGTEVTLGASQALTQGCWIKAFAANTGDISVGLTGVTVTTGYLLDAGEETFVPIANRTTIFIDATVNGEDVSYICF